MSKSEVDKIMDFYHAADSVVWAEGMLSKKPLKLCKDCRHFVFSGEVNLAFEYAVCAKLPDDFVAGAVDMSLMGTMSCRDMRGSFCGYEAQFFEAKE